MLIRRVTRRQAIDLFVAAGPDAGIIEYRIDDGPVQTLDTFTQWSAGLNLPWAYILDADLAPGNHALCLEMSLKKSSESKGNALRIRHFPVNP
ncbi:MAG: hypothetical protein GY809_27965 [Planctomycetes bacterium]|nr:hypothetical protein [Planctomycetota bacterium]